MAEPRALMGNSTSAKQAAHADRVIELREHQFAADLAAVLATPEGVRVWWALMDRWSAWTTVGDGSDLPTRMAYLSGKRDAALQLYNDANSVPGALLRISEEQACQQVLLFKPAPAASDDSTDEESDA